VDLYFYCLSRHHGVLSIMTILLGKEIAEYEAKGDTITPSVRRGSSKYSATVFIPRHEIEGRNPKDWAAPQHRLVTCFQSHVLRLTKGAHKIPPFPV
jgi:hypothetical protein